MTELADHPQTTMARAAGILAALGVAPVSDLARAAGLQEVDVEAARDYYEGRRTADVGRVSEAQPTSAVKAQPFQADTTSSLAVSPE